MERQATQAFWSWGDGFSVQNEVHVNVLNPQAVSAAPSGRRW